jgi:uncharacterized LabA/DUF88 family protein
MSAQDEKIALFIDGANLYTTAKSLGLDIDYKRLLREFQSRGHLLRAFYYTAAFNPTTDRLARIQRLHGRYQGGEGVRRS